jgi:streptogramin lyase
VSGCAHWGGSTSVAIAPSTGAVVGSSRLESLVFGDGKAWGFNGGAGPEVREIDPATGRVIDTLDRHYAFALGYAFHSLWLYGNGVVAQLDPDTGSVLQYYSLPAGADAFPIHGKGGGFVSAGGYVWLTAYDGDVYGPDVSSGAVYRLDPSTGQVVRALSIALDPTMSTETLGPEAFLDAHDGTVWVAKSPDTVVGIDAHTGRVVESYPAGGHGAVDVLATDDSLWVVNSTGTVWRYAR